MRRQGGGWSMCYTSDGIGDVDMFGDYGYSDMRPYGRRCSVFMLHICPCFTCASLAFIFFIVCHLAHLLLLSFISGYRSDCRNVAFSEVMFIIHPPLEPSTWSQSSPPLLGNTARFKYSGSSVLRLSESSFKAAALGRAAWPQDATQASGSHVWRLDGSDAPYQLLVCANQQWNLGFTFWSTDGNACTPQASATLLLQSMQSFFAFA